VVACDTPEGLLQRVAGDVVVVQADDAENLAREIFARWRDNPKAIEREGAV